MQLLDDDKYSTFLKWFRLRRSQNLTNLSYAIIYAQLVTILLNYVIDVLFDENARNKFFFWVGLYLLMEVFFVSFDALVWRMYIRVKKQPALFERLQELDKRNNQENTRDQKTLIHKATDFFSQAMSPKSAAIATEEIATQTTINTMYPMSPQSKRQLDETARSKLWLWSTVTSLSRQINAMRQVLEGYSISMSLSFLVDYMFPNHKTNKIYAWLLVLVMVWILKLTRDCWLGRYERQIEQELPASVYIANQDFNEEEIAARHQMTRPKTKTYSRVSLQT